MNTHICCPESSVDTGSVSNMGVEFGPSTGKSQEISAGMGSYCTSLSKWYSKCGVQGYRITQRLDPYEVFPVR